MIAILSSVTAAYLYHKISGFRYKNIIVALAIISLVFFGIKEVAIMLILGVMWYYINNKVLVSLLTVGIFAGMYFMLLTPKEIAVILVSTIVFLLVSNDLNSSDHAIRKIGGMALTDPLTGAYNRNFYNNILDDLLRNSLETKNRFHI